MDHLERVAGEQRVGDRDIDRGLPCRAQALGRTREGVPGTGDVVEQHHRAPGHLRALGRGDIDLAVAVAELDYDGIEPVAPRRGLDPLRRLGIRPHQQRAVAARDRHVGEQAGAGQRDRMRHRNRLGETGDAVQVGIDRDDAVEQPGQESADDALAHHLARMEGLVLAHVGQIGRDQDEVAHAAAPGAARHQQQPRAVSRWDGAGCGTAPRWPAVRPAGAGATRRRGSGGARSPPPRVLPHARGARLLALVVEMQQQGVFGTHWRKITRRAAAVAAQKFTPWLQNGTRSAVRPEACHVARQRRVQNSTNRCGTPSAVPARSAGAHAGLAGEPRSAG